MCISNCSFHLFICFYLFWGVSVSRFRISADSLQIWRWSERVLQEFCKSSEEVLARKVRHKWSEVFPQATAPDQRHMSMGSILRFGPTYMYMYKTSNDRFLYTAYCYQQQVAQSSNFTYFELFRSSFFSMFVGYKPFSSLGKGAPTPLNATGNTYWRKLHEIKE